MYVEDLLMEAPDEDKLSLHLYEETLKKSYCINNAPLLVFKSQNESTVNETN